MNSDSAVPIEVKDLTRRFGAKPALELAIEDLGVEAHVAAAEVAAENVVADVLGARTALTMLDDRANELARRAATARSRSSTASSEAVTSRCGEPPSRPYRCSRSIPITRAKNDASASVV